MSVLELTSLYDTLDTVSFSEYNGKTHMDITIRYSDTRDELNVEINKEHAKQIIEHLQQQFGL